MPNTPLYIPELVNRGKWNDYRDEIWGDSYNWSWVRQWSQVKYLVIHHTVTSIDATPNDIALLHKARGWAGIGYHFVVDHAGVVYYVGDISTARANVLDKNEQVIGISMIGDFTKHLPSDEQIRSVHELCKFFLYNVPALPNVNGWEDVVGHKDLQATACPGTSWPDDMKWRIQTGTVYSPQPTPNPEPVPPVVIPPVEPTPPPVEPIPPVIPTPNPTPEPCPELPEIIIDLDQKIDFGTQWGVMSLKVAKEQLTLAGQVSQKLQDQVDEGVRIKESKNWWWVKYALWSKLFSK